MQKNQINIKPYLNLFLPSAISAVLVVFLTAFVMIVNQFDAIKGYFQIPEDLQFGRTLAGWLDMALTMTLGESITQTVVVGLFWAIVGLVVYAFLRGLAHFMLELGSDLDEQRYVWPRGTNRLRPLLVLVEQGVFRVAILLVLFLVIFYPLAAVLRGPVFVDFIGQSEVLQYIGWFLASVVVMHAIVVLARLFAFRERLLG